MPRRTGIVTRISRWLAGLAAGVLIVLALLVGLARLLLPMVPEYQAEIRRFAMEATGLDIRFGNLSATWPIAGPEVRLYDVQVSTRDGGLRVLDARELRVGVNLVQVVTEGRVAPGRFRLVGSRIRAERTAGGQLLINGVPLEELLRQPPAGRLPRVDVRVEDVQVSFADPARLVPEVVADVRELALEVRRDGIAFAGEILPGLGLGRTLALSGRIPAALLPGPQGRDRDVPAGTDWSVEATGTDLDLAGWLRVLANQDWPLVAGRGDLALRAGFQGMAALNLELDLRASGIRIRESGDAALGLDQLDAVLRWQADNAGWSLELDRLVARQGPGPARVSRGQARYEKAGDQAARLTASSAELHPGDIYPLARALASAELRRTTLPESIGGTLRNLDLEARWGGGEPAAWQARAALEEVGLTLPAPGLAVTGITGQLDATDRNGRLELASTALVLRLPTLFRKDIVLTSARGPLGWRTGPAGLEVVGDDLRLSAAEGRARGRLQVRFPPGASPVVDVTARAEADSARAALEWLPLQKFKPNVVAWLDRAVVAGKVPRADLVWQGPLRGFPYREGDGQFQVRFSVTEGVLDYASEWPRAENLSAEVLVDRWTLTSTENRATLAGVAVANAQVRVPDLARDPTVAITAEQALTAGPLLNFLRQSPIARMLGPTLANVTSSGQLVGDLRLSVPLARLRDTRVDGRFTVDRATLGLRGVEFGLTGLKGVVELDNTRLRAEGITGRFLDEPVEIALRPAESGEEGLSHVAVIRGRTPAAKLSSAFSLPYPEQLAGETGWEAVTEIPDRQNLQPLRIRITSDLEGLVSTLPVPLAKPAGALEPLELEVRLPERNRLEVDGRIERGASWALRFESGPGPGWRLARGSLRNGPPLATAPSQPGLTIGGRFQELRFEDWFPAGDAGAGGDARGAQLREITVDVEALAAFGRVFRQVRLDAERTREAWEVGVRSERASGRITVPLADGTAPINAVMERLWLVEEEPVGDGDGSPDRDPRRLPALNARVDDFVLADMRLGRLEAEVVQRGDGVVVEPLEITGRGFRIKGNALWVVTDGDPARQRSELQLQLDSDNLAATLAALGYDPVMEGRQGDVALDVVWPGGPRKDFLSVAAGRLTLSLSDGQFLAVEPGSGRILGLLSVAALPRRLGLDFRDVLDEGLAFDKVKGEFRLDSGTAITCNLGLEGPVADLGMVGRVGLADRSYDQIAVARPHVSDVLALGGAVVGGPVLGGAVLLISQIFRKPLSSLGENYYTVTGSWDKPVVNKVQRSEVDVTPFKDCERYLAEALRLIPAGVDTER